MKTTFILHGGNTSTDSLDNANFYSYFTNQVEKGKVKILVCPWARERSTWEEKLEKHRSRIADNTDKSFDLVVAEDPSDLLAKLDDCDVLYIDGGASESIRPIYETINELKDKVKGKVVIGSSMGAFVICSYFVLSFDEQDTDTVYEGLRLLPLNFLAHWNMEEEKDKKIALIKSKSALPILTLNEGESVIIHT